VGMMISKTTVNKMAPYVYSQLDNQKQDIRVLTLLPGSFEDPIRLVISHEVFDQADYGREQSSIDLSQYRVGLPPNWDVLATLEGRIVYNFADPQTGHEHSSWTHPDPGLKVGGSENPNIHFKEDKVIYEALSYTWGHGKNLQTAYVYSSFAEAQGNTVSSATMELRDNLACALKHLRYLDKKRRLWVDALCINQSDDIEREFQVSRMDRVYISAVRVIVWLGPGSESTQLAVSTLSHLGRQIEVSRWGSMPSPGCAEPSWYHTGSVLPYNDQAWRAIYEFINVSWFERLWVIQEIQLANSNSVVLCGAHEISWRLLRRSLLCLSMKRAIIPENIMQCILKSLSLTLPSREQTLQTSLYQSRFALCSKPVDKIYGILGISPPRFVRQLVPDYRAYYGEAYKTAFLEHAKIVCRFELFGWCSLSQPVMKMPTWVPNFSKVCAPFPLQNRGICYASGFSRCHYSYKPGKVLNVLGLRIATVAAVSQSAIESFTDLFNIFNFIQVEENKNNRYVTGQPLLDAIASTLSCCFLSERFPSMGTSVLSLEELKNAIMTHPGSVIKDKVVEQKLKSLMLHVQGRRLFTTKEGLMGLCQDCTLPGK